MMINLTDTISLIEVIWMLINAPMLALNIFGRAHARRKLRVMSVPGIAQQYPARWRMVRQNVRNSGGRIVFNGGFLILGIAAAFQPNRPLTPTSMIFTVVLFLVAGYFAYCDVREYLDRIELDRMVTDGRFERTARTYTAVDRDEVHG